MKYEELILKLENYIKSQPDPLLKKLIKLSVYCLYYNSENRLSSNELIKISKKLKTKNIQEIDQEYLHLIEKRSSQFKTNKKIQKSKILKHPKEDYSDQEIEIPNSFTK